MKTTLNSFGRDALLQVSGGRLFVATRLVAYAGPAPKELADREGAALPAQWKRALAGLPAQFAAAEDVRPNSIPADVDQWPLVADRSVCPSLSGALAFVEPIVEPDSPRNYGTVAALFPDCVAATDGFRLNWSEVRLEQAAEGLCIPGAVLPIVIRALKSGALGARVSEDRTTLAVIGDSWTLCVRLAAVKYPNWRGVLPKPGQSKPVEFDAPALVTEARAKAKALKRAEMHYLEPVGLPTNMGLNARFLADCPDSADASWRLAEDGEVLVGSLGGNHWVVALARVRDDEQTKQTGTEG